MSDQLKDTYDAVIVGGGAAGLNGALMLARSRRSVAVIDAGAPRNAPAAAVHGLLARDGTAPGELLERGRAEVRGYGGYVAAGEVICAWRDGDAFAVGLADGRAVRARRILVAAGLVDELPDIPGLARRWGRDVVHCPYCHGWEVRDAAIGVVATGPMAVHQALMFRQLSADVVLLSHDQPAPAGERAEQLAARGIRVVDGAVAAIEVAEDRIAGLRMSDGRLVARDVVAVATRMRARAGFLAGLGLHPAAHPSGMGEHIPAEPDGRTAVDGVWAAGNTTDLAAQVGAAAAAGAAAGAGINADLITEDTRRAVEAYRDPFPAGTEAHLCEQAAGAARHGLEDATRPDGPGIAAGTEHA
ncbi:NAD(P)/FAD-dependent oxidoreductase [Streptomonospora salina]|uniref:Thioredoxin reductase n=1 Tax=Streptomonospora salina TaxID=104205 RepID=A0A841EJH1_9ACTN|nr:NAD(P)/FAD-dependent oxidoreductase [Streptomonospora salina]MBB6000938.1 thioredoxin reductase [Streptomonospora salina]